MQWRNDRRVAIKMQNRKEGMNKWKRKRKKNMNEWMQKKDLKNEREKNTSKKEAMNKWKKKFLNE